MPERIIERTFVERDTEPLQAQQPIHIEVPAPPPVAAPHVTVNIPERSKDEPNVSGTDKTNNGAPYPETERAPVAQTNLSPVVEEPAQEVGPTKSEQKPVDKNVPPANKKRSGEESKEVNTPLPARKPEIKKRANGKPGRKNTELQHAINWIVWERTGFDKSKCPWKNPYECKKHQPPDENLIEARRFLGFDF